jgi:hypothetical protein
MYNNIFGINTRKVTINLPYSNMDADRDEEQRLHFATWERQEEGTLHNTWFSEAHFHLDGIVKNQDI